LQILVTDDSEEDLLIAQRVIRAAKVKNPVTLLRGAAQCISHFEDASPGTQPVLLFLDLVMFPKNGLDVLSCLKNNPLLKSSLTVMLTGLGDVRFVQQGYRAGAATFLFKPFALEDFTNFLNCFTRHIVTDNTAEGKFLRWANSPRAALSGSAGLDEAGQQNRSLLDSIRQEHQRSKKLGSRSFSSEVEGMGNNGASGDL
jgi:response regulator RpfG family c-di-GMP phosphodiesterase